MSEVLPSMDELLDRAYKKGMEDARKEKTMGWNEYLDEPTFEFTENELKEHDEQIRADAIEGMTKCKDALCHSCKQYDREHYKCPIWCKVIEGTIDEIKYQTRADAIDEVTDRLSRMNCLNPIIILELKQIKEQKTDD